MHVGLGSGVEQQHVALAEGVDVAMIVERFAVSGADGWERIVVALSQTDFHYCGHDFFLSAAGLSQLKGFEMHIDRDADGFLDFGNFLGTLVIAHIYEGIDEVQRRLGVLTQEFVEEQLTVAAVGRNEVNLLLVCFGVLNMLKEQS